MYILPQRSARIGAKVVTFICVASYLPASAQVYTLTDGNAQVQMNVNGMAMMQTLSVDGSPSLVGREGFWSNLGGPVAPFSGMAQQTAANAVSFFRNSIGLPVDIDYVLTGGEPGSGEATLTETAHAANFVFGAAGFSLYNYNDFNLTAHDHATFLAPDSLLQQGDDGSTLTQTCSLLPTHYEVNNPAVLLGEINQGVPTVKLSDTPAIGTLYPPAPGDVSFAFQWNLDFSPITRIDFSTTKHIYLHGAPSTVPEPNSLLLVAFGAIPGAALLKRKRR